MAVVRATVQTCAYLHNAVDHTYCDDSAAEKLLLQSRYATHFSFCDSWSCTRWCCAVNIDETTYVTLSTVYTPSRASLYPHARVKAPMKGVSYLQDLATAFFCSCAIHTHGTLCCASNLNLCSGKPELATSDSSLTVDLSKMTLSV
jgi:hypothetical protein